MMREDLEGKVVLGRGELSTYQGPGDKGYYARELFPMEKAH
jgi:hypothetical protein